MQTAVLRVHPGMVLFINTGQEELFISVMGVLPETVRHMPLLQLQTQVSLQRDQIQQFAVWGVTVILTQQLPYIRSQKLDGEELQTHPLPVPTAGVLTQVTRDVGLVIRMPFQMDAFPQVLELRGQPFQGTILHGI